MLCEVGKLINVYFFMLCEVGKLNEFFEYAPEAITLNIFTFMLEMKITIFS